MSSPLSIVSVSGELAPFSKTGGLGEVARALPRALRDLGHKVVAVTPLHRGIRERFPGIREIGAADITLGRKRQKSIRALFYEGDLDLGGVPTYFIDHPPFFSQHRTLYDSGNANERFFFFNRATFALLKELGLKADVIQCHDWHAALIPYLIHTAEDDRKLPATVFTIHNLNFQMGRDWWTLSPDEQDPGILPPEERYDRGTIELVNFALRGIRFADSISTVSENYCREIQTKQFGENLQQELKKRRRDLFGIVNGVDYEVYNPRTDPGLAASYDSDTLERKAMNKQALQKLCYLPDDPNVAVLGMVSRISEQKGFDLILEILDVLVKLKVQLVIMGSGDKRYERAFREARRRYPKSFSYLAFDPKYETLVYAGSDLFLMPSRFEPCGLGQLISLRYGSIPVVHAVGGLTDTVQDYNPRTERGNGFVFKKYDSREFLAAIVRGVENWSRNEEPWRKLLERSMREVYSWSPAARRYVSLFRHTMKQHEEECLHLTFQPRNAQHETRNSQQTQNVKSQTRPRFRLSGSASH